MSRDKCQAWAEQSRLTSLILPLNLLFVVSEDEELEPRTLIFFRSDLHIEYK